MLGRQVVAGLAVALGILMYVGMFSIGPYLAPIVLALLWVEEAMEQNAQPVSNPRINLVQHFARVWFSLRGDISRRTYWLGGILGFFAFQFTVSLLLLWFDLLRDLDPGDAGFTRVARNFLFFALTPYGMVAICAKRARDIGRSGWWGVAVLIPGVASLLLLEMAARESLSSAIVLSVTAVQGLFLIAFGVLPGRRATA